MLIMVCMAIYAVLVQGIAAGDDMMGPIWTCGGKRAAVFRSLQDRELSKSYGALTKRPL